MKNKIDVSFKRIVFLLIVFLVLIICVLQLYLKRVAQERLKAETHDIGYLFTPSHDGAPRNFNITQMK